MSFNLRGGRKEERDRRGYLVQAPSPEASLNVSAGHAVGVPPSGPVYPGFATHAVEPVAPPVAKLVGQLHVQEGEW